MLLNFYIYPKLEATANWQEPRPARNNTWNNKNELERERERVLSGQGRYKSAWIEKWKYFFDCCTILYASITGYFRVCIYLCFLSFLSCSFSLITSFPRYSTDHADTSGECQYINQIKNLFLVNSHQHMKRQEYRDIYLFLFSKYILFHQRETGDCTTHSGAQRSSME